MGNFVLMEVVQGISSLRLGTIPTSGFPIARGLLIPRSGIDSSFREVLEKVKSRLYDVVSHVVLREKLGSVMYEGDGRRSVIYS